MNVFGLIRFFVDGVVWFFEGVVLFLGEGVGVVLLLGDGFGIVWFFFGCWVFEG